MNLDDRKPAPTAGRNSGRDCGLQSGFGLDG
jgi:hypothetical protein